MGGGFFGNDSRESGLFAWFGRCGGIIKDGQVGILLGKILEVVGELAIEVDELIEAQCDLEEYMEEIDFDLADLERRAFFSR